MISDDCEFRWPVRVYYEDTDVGGVVYYANYLKFMERARTEWLRELGYEQDVLIREQDLLFAVQSVAVRYHRPARFNDLLQVSVAISRSGRASLELYQRVTRPCDTGQETLLADGEVKLASLCATSFRPKPLPPQLAKALKRAH